MESHYEREYEITGWNPTMPQESVAPTWTCLSHVSQDESGKNIDERRSKSVEFVLRTRATVADGPTYDRRWVSSTNTLCVPMVLPKTTKVAKAYSIPVSSCWSFITTERKRVTDASDERRYEKQERLSTRRRYRNAHRSVCSVKRA